jgi:hypothetical protein
VRRQLILAIAVLAVAASILAQEKEIKRLDGSTIKRSASVTAWPGDFIGLRTARPFSKKDTMIAGETTPSVSAN